MVTLIIGEHGPDCLIDSESGCSLTDEKVAKNAIGLAVKGQSVCLRAVAGSPFEALKNIVPAVRLVDRVLNKNFAVMRNLAVPAILGIDLLRSTVCILNLDNG